MEKEKQEIKKWSKIIVIALFGYLIVDNVNIVGDIVRKIVSIISPFVVGAAIAFILNLPMGFFEEKLSSFKTKKGKKLNKGFIRAISLILSILVIALILTLVVNLIVPEIINVISLLIEKLPYYGAELKSIATKITEDVPQVNDIIKSIDINDKDLQNQVKNFATNFLTKSVSVAGNIVSSMFNTVVSVVFAAYILTSKDKLKLQVKKVLYAYNEKEKAEKVIELGKEVRRIFRKFISGQCLEAIILGSLSIIGMLILQIPYAVTIGVLIGVTSLIPIVGAFIGIIIGAILILSIAPTKVLTFIIYILILQQIEGNLIYPKVVGESVGLPGIWVLVAVAIGGDLFGIVGMLLGVPTASVLYMLFKQNVYKKLKEKQII